MKFSIQIGVIRALKINIGKIKLFLCFLFFIMFIWIYYSESRVERSSCSTLTTASVFSDKHSDMCVPLQPIKFLDESDVTKVKGTYMEDTEEVRPLMKFLIEPRDIVSGSGSCTSGLKKSDIKWNLAFLIKSSVTNAGRRAAIRATWGAVKLLNSTRLEIIFIVGVSEDNRVQTAIAKESEKYGDILQMNIIDSPKTVPEKVLAGMQWARQALPSHWLYASADDDIVVHVGNLIAFFDTLLQPIRDSEKESMRPCYEDLPLVCVYSYQGRDPPSRNIFGKWYISYWDYPNSKWPKYCRGGLYVMSVKMTGQLHEMSRRTKYLYLDDVWITGFMRRKLHNQDCNILPAPYSVKSDTAFWQNIDNANEATLVKHLWGNIDLYHAKIEEEMKLLWEKWKKKLVHRSGLCMET